MEDLGRRLFTAENAKIAEIKKERITTEYTENAE